MKKTIQTLVIQVLIFLSIPVLGSQYQTVTGITIEGLIHTSTETVTKALTIKKHRQLSQEKITNSINALYKTGYFDNVEIKQAGGVVKIVLTERRYINRVTISGVKLVPEEKLTDMQKKLGVVRGHFHNQANINAFTVALKQVYDSLGYYNASITLVKTPRDNNTIDMTLDVKEGSQAKIRQIAIIGNRSFTQRSLLGLFSLHKTNLFSVITGNDKYAKQKLDADLEALRSHYMNQGFINVQIDSVGVAITPDKKNIYITIHLTENKRYKVDEVILESSIPEYDNEMKSLITVKKGDQFARGQLLDSASKIKQLLGNYGYANAKVEPMPKLNHEKNTVAILYKVTPGKKVTVRRIDFFGNTVTDTKVLRRELRQLESSQFSLDNIKESERRLANIKWIKDVNMMIEPVVGHDDQIDLAYNLSEQSSAQIMAEASLSDMTGFIYRFSLTQDNFLGTGKSASISTSHSKSSESLNISYSDPYLTEDGISQRIGIYQTESKPGRLSQTDYIRNVAGISMNIGYPISAYTRMFYGANYEHSKIITGGELATEINTFLSQYGDKKTANTNEFDQLELSTGISYNNYDNGYWPKKGLNHSLNIKYTAPLTKESLSYYKLGWGINWYKQATDSLIFNANASVSYGDGVGSTSTMPFYEHYHAGGIGTIAGFDSYSLGPKDSTGRSYGGNLQTLASLNLIFPNNLGDNVRTAVFVNAGNVFHNQVEWDEMRYSAGLSLTWKSIMGPLEFILAKPLNDKLDDRTRTFDFAIGFGM
jgi:outer membrane protein insertion porin family